MKKKNITESKISSIIKQYEGGRAIDDLCRENGISKATIYNWKKKYSGTDGVQVSQLKDFQEENRRLKHRYNELSLTGPAIMGKKQILRIYNCFICFLICVPGAFSQTVLRGHVFSEEAHKPLVSVSVYLNNTSIGTITNDDGLFILKGIPQGKFNLVATCVGFETYSSLFDLRDVPKDFQIIMKTKADELQGFSVLPTDPNGWEKYGKYFTLLMIGTTPNSNNTKLMNPEVVKFRLNEGNILTAFAKEPLRFTNYTLGYEIEYKMEEFEVNLNTALVNYTGYAFFKEMGLKHPNRVRRYLEARFETYKGSLLHFMRSFYANDLDVQGFEMRSLAMIDLARRYIYKIGGYFKEYSGFIIIIRFRIILIYGIIGDGFLCLSKISSHYYYVPAVSLFLLIYFFYALIFKAPEGRVYGSFY